MTDRDIRTSLFNSEEPSVRHQNDQTHMLHVRDEEVAALRDELQALRMQLDEAQAEIVELKIERAAEKVVRIIDGAKYTLVDADGEHQASRRVGQ